jgi:hypothetical protein
LFGNTFVVVYSQFADQTSTVKKGIDGYDDRY